jgi:hypothetical protein
VRLCGVARSCLAIPLGGHVGVLVAVISLLVAVYSGHGKDRMKWGLKLKGGRINLLKAVSRADSYVLKKSCQSAQMIWHSLALYAFCDLAGTLR